MRSSSLQHCTLWIAACVALLQVPARAQVPAAPPSASKAAQPVPATPTTEADNGSVTVPQGTEIPLVLIHAISGKNIRPGDSIYLSSSFPVTIDNRVVIPVGSYVQGTVASVRRGGRIHGRSEMLVHFRNIVLPNGYTIRLAGSVNGAPELTDAKVKDKEGTIQHNGEKGKDAVVIAAPAAYGTLIGAERSGKGALEGAAIGGGAGLLWTLLSRGSDIYLPRGMQLNMVLQRPLTLPLSALNFNGYSAPQPAGWNAPPPPPRKSGPHIPLVPRP